MSGVRLISNLVELCMYTQWFPPSSFTHSLTLSRSHTVFTPRVERMNMDHSELLSAGSLPLARPHGFISAAAKKKKKEIKKKIEKRSSENILLSACDCWLFDHYYCWCFTVSNVACFLWFSLFILEVVVVSHTHTPVQNSIRKKHNLSQKKKNVNPGAFSSICFTLLAFIFIGHIYYLILLILNTLGNI